MTGCRGPFSSSSPWLLPSPSLPNARPPWLPSLTLDPSHPSPARFLLPAEADRPGLSAQTSSLSTDVPKSALASTLGRHRFPFGFCLRKAEESDASVLASPGSGTPWSRKLRLIHVTPLTRPGKTCCCSVNSRRVSSTVLSPGQTRWQVDPLGARHTPERPHQARMRDAHTGRHCSLSVPERLPEPRPASCSALQRTHLLRRGHRPGALPLTAQPLPGQPLSTTTLRLSSEGLSLSLGLHLCSRLSHPITLLLLPSSRMRRRWVRWGGGAPPSCYFCVLRA